MKQTWPDRIISSREHSQALLAVRGVDIFCKAIFRDFSQEVDGLPSFPRQATLPQKISLRFSAFMDKLPGVPESARQLLERNDMPLTRAAVALLNGQIDTARELLAITVTEHGSSYPGWAGDMNLRLRAEAHRLAGDHQAASVDFEHLIIRYPLLRFLQIDLAWLQFQCGDLVQAQKTLYHLDLNNDSEWSALTAGELACGLLLSGNVHLSLGQYSAAEADFCLAGRVAGSKRNELRATAEFHRSRAAFLAGYPLQALQSAERAVSDSSHPVPAERLFFRGHLRWHCGDLSGARSDLEAAVALAPEQTSWLEMLELLRQKPPIMTGEMDCSPLWQQDWQYSSEKSGEYKIDSDHAAPYITHTAAADLFHWRLTDDPIYPGPVG